MTRSPRNGSAAHPAPESVQRPGLAACDRGAVLRRVLKDDWATCEAGCGEDFRPRDEGEARPLPLCARCFLLWMGRRAQ